MTGKENAVSLKLPTFWISHPHVLPKHTPHMHTTLTTPLVQTLTSMGEGLLCTPQSFVRISFKTEKPGTRGSLCTPHPLLHLLHNTISGSIFSAQFLRQTTKKYISLLKPKPRFNPRKIIAEDTKFFYILSALDLKTATHLLETSLAATQKITNMLP